MPADLRLIQRFSSTFRVDQVCSHPSLHLPSLLPLSLHFLMLKVISSFKYMLL